MRASKKTLRYRLEFQSRNGQVFEREFVLNSPVLRPQLTMRLMLLAKRLLDIILAAAGLLMLSPLLLVVALAVKLDSKGPIFFKAKRVGRYGEVFLMYKFRTMCIDAESRLNQLSHLNQGGPYMIKIPNDPRVTRMGRILRRTSIDELPQLLNVLRGEMSLVGPRPQSPGEVALYTPLQRCRLEMPPGITGLWQVTSRHVPDFDEWIHQDLTYITHWSLALDVEILFRTVGVIRSDVKKTS